MDGANFNAMNRNQTTALMWTAIKGDDLLWNANNIFLYFLFILFIQTIHALCILLPIDFLVEKSTPNWFFPSNLRIPGEKI